ncbi:nucleotide-binding alpha-beta plait domain-containing protein [Tanacetum coccineum]|uniref:Nucleotide-binding alpha-beta plait domain-containing protein n=1 Tax=Tanacetum coccineum TaxID=301880 RepID=A0ABQ5C9N0_9ASTR
MGIFRTKEDDVAKISTSIYVSNFPEMFSAKDLFHACKKYGHVIDSFIPFKKSKDRKRFGFVRFINVFNTERLVSNLCTIWVGRSKFHANVARFHRTPVKINKASKDNVYEPKRKSNVNENGSSNAGKSYAHVLKTHNSFEALDCESAPSIVLDDVVLIHENLSLRTCWKSPGDGFLEFADENSMIDDVSEEGSKGELQMMPGAFKFDDAERCGKVPEDLGEALMMLTSPRYREKEQNDQERINNYNGSKDEMSGSKKLFTRHLKEYGHDRHTKIAKLIPKIPKLKWRTKGNYQDCGIFTMLHMESYNAGAVANWDCGLVAESGLQLDMLRRLRFKFATKILLHEINVHAQKMLDLAKEFDKLESDEKVSIIIHALKNRKERDRI